MDFIDISTKYLQIITDELKGTAYENSITKGITWKDIINYIQSSIIDQSFPRNNLTTNHNELNKVKFTSYDEFEKFLLDNPLLIPENIVFTPLMDEADNFKEDKTNTIEEFEAFSDISNDDESNTLKEKSYEETSDPLNDSDDENKSFLLTFEGLPNNLHDTLDQVVDVSKKDPELTILRN